MFIQSVGWPEYQWGRQEAVLQGMPGDRAQEGHGHVGMQSPADPGWGVTGAFLSPTPFPPNSTRHPAALGPDPDLSLPSQGPPRSSCPWHQAQNFSSSGQVGSALRRP